MNSEAIAAYIKELEQKTNQYARSIELLTEQLESKAVDEQVYRDLEKAQEIIKAAGIKLEKLWNSRLETLPGWAIDLIGAAKKLG